MASELEDIKEIQILGKKLNHEMMEDWRHHFVFTFKWWVLLILTILPWIIWWKIVDKKRVIEIFIYGLLILILSTFIDVLGWNYSLWMYPDTLLALCTPLVPIDMTVLPVCFMLIYQFTELWKTFILSNTLLSMIFSFVVEPFLEFINLYHPYHWKSIYSFLIYIVLAIFCRWLVKKIISKQEIVI